MKSFVEKVLALFFVFGFLFLPLTLNGKDWQFELTKIIFSKPIAIIQTHFFPKALQVIDFSSDTIGLNLLLALLFLLAIVIVLLLNFLKIKTNKIIFISRVISCYYIAFILLNYGFDKVDKTQFYLPEPNVLYTSFGNLSKDILYWSTLGTSHFYSISMGIIEVFTAILLLIKRTRIVGLLFSIGIFVNIILINFGFDISVKTFSVFLLLATLFSVYPNLKKLINFLVFQRKEQLMPHKQSIVNNPFLKIWTKSIVVGLLFLQVLFPYLKTQNFNDDLQSRPFLHGAYQVNQFIVKSDTLKTSDFPILKIFIHRNNYIIFQGKNNEMTDYHFEIDTIKKQLLLQDYQKNNSCVNYDYVKKDSIFKLKFNNYYIISKALNWRKLPALQNQTHYTIDQIQ
ncbi:hypothetical protein [Flavobacterium sp.]|uniref:hypothetical protein n=1 Tax=Flavobacterium sp. TaxID=239 RepID=UPI003BC0C039